MTSRTLAEQIITELRTAANPDEISVVAALIEAWVRIRCLEVALMESRRWYVEFVWPWRADDEETTLRAQDWIGDAEAALATALDQLECK